MKPERALVLDMQPREVRALCARAARGAGYGWDLAEEAGYAAEWLEQVNWPGAYLVSVLLQEVEAQGPDQYRPDPGRNGWCRLNSAVCPITLGAFLSRNGWVFASDGRLNVRRLLVPALLLPFLAGLQHGRSSGSGISWAGTRLMEYSGRLDALGSDTLTATAGPVTIAPLIQRPGHLPPEAIERPSDPRDVLEAFARRS